MMKVIQKYLIEKGLRGLTMIDMKQGLTNNEKGLMKFNWNNSFTSKTKYIVKKDDLPGVFDELLYFPKKQKLFGLLHDEGKGSNLYCYDFTDNKMTQYRASTGELLPNNKLFKDIFEVYLAVQLDNTSFIVITDIESEKGRDIGAVVEISQKKIQKIIGIRIFKIDNLIVCGINGVIMKYDILNNKKLSYITSVKLDLKNEEEVDSFEILNNGEIIGFTTMTKSPDCKPQRLIIQKISEWKKNSKSWVFDFNQNVEKYSILEKFSNFEKIFLNFHVEKSPLIVAIQGNSRGKNCHLFVGILKGEEIVEVDYLKDIVKGSYIDSGSYLNNIYILDSFLNLRVIKLPLAKK